ncbi:MAG: CHAT domain-containing protein [Spirulinaceae cyanobacterium RM2_2_10]|nr:CHAT domain-containing protein [Spirulinaceae cyanobacterium RM2_2_10]
MKGCDRSPLAALHDGEQFLIERYRFSIIPSLSLLNLNYVDVRDANILAMGISEFQHLSPLPAVPVELAAIKEQFTRGEVILNEGFTLANLKQQRQAVRAKVLHLATHAEFVPGDDGFIEFWERSVSLQQLATLDWHDPELALLVLSACRTALGDVEAEYGFAGLATSSGVDTAIASLWYASDVGTLGLMSEFYIHLRHLPLKSEALRQAQLSLLRGELQLAAGQIEAESGVLPLPPELTTLAIATSNTPTTGQALSRLAIPGREARSRSLSPLPEVTRRRDHCRPVSSRGSSRFPQGSRRIKVSTH